MDVIPNIFQATSQTLPEAAGGWTTTVTPAADTSSGALSVLQGKMTAGAMLSTKLAGFGTAVDKFTAAGSAFMQSRQDQLEGDVKALQIKQQLIRQVGQARVAFAGSGVTAGGSETAVESGLTQEAAFETQYAQNNARLKSLSDQARAAALGSQATLGLLSTKAKVDAMQAGYDIDIAKRG